VKTATSSGVTFKAALVRDSKAAITGDIETKYNLKHHGLTLTQTWTTTNVLRTQVELENQIAKGLKFDLATALLPEKGSKSALLTATYKQPGLHTRAFLDIFKVRHPISRTRPSESPNVII
jgi:voltage-dependent anion channel protein 2